MQIEYGKSSARQTWSWLACYFDIPILMKRCQIMTMMKMMMNLTSEMITIAILMGCHKVDDKNLAIGKRKINWILPTNWGSKLWDHFKAGNLELADYFYGQKMGIMTLNPDYFSRPIILNELTIGLIPLFSGPKKVKPILSTFWPPGHSRSFFL